MQSAKSRRDTTTTPTEFEAKDGFEVAFKRFPETQMAQLYGQRKEGKFCDAVLHCTDGEIKLHRYHGPTECGQCSRPIQLNPNASRVDEYDLGILSRDI